MFDIVAANEHEAPSAVYVCLVDACELRLASALGAAAEPPAAEPAHQPERQREQAEHHNDEEDDLERSFAEQSIHRSSLRPRVRRLDRNCPNG